MAACLLSARARRRASARVRTVILAVLMVDQDRSAVGARGRKPATAGRRQAHAGSTRSSFGNAAIR
jgi:hypothetical protein